MKFISRVRYVVDMGCGLDIWRISGIVDTNEVYISTPISYDYETDIIETKSGSIYKIVSYEMDKDKFHEQITQSIKNGGYEVVK